MNTEGTTYTGYVCSQCGYWVPSGQYHACGFYQVPTPIQYTIFPPELIEVLKEIRDLLKELKTNPTQGENAST